MSLDPSCTLSKIYICCDDLRHFLVTKHVVSFRIGEIILMLGFEINSYFDYSASYPPLLTTYSAGAVIIFVRCRVATLSNKKKLCQDGLSECKTTTYLYENTLASCPSQVILKHIFYWFVELMLSSLFS